MVKTNNQRADRGKNRKSGNDPKPTYEQERKALAKQLGIRPKTKEFIDLLNADPKLNATEAYIQTHKTINRQTAANAASKLLLKPSVIGYKDAAVKRAKRRVVELVDSANEQVALKAADSIIDRNEGKAVQKNETLSRVVEVKLDLTGVKLGNHYLTPAQRVALTP